MSITDAFNNLLNRFVIAPLASRLAGAQATQMGQLNVRLDALEKRLLNYHHNRWDAIDSMADYLVGAEVPGHYLEFGVFQGTTFSHALLLMSPVFAQMKFYAFDSFAGLPSIQGVDNSKDYSSGFHEGQFQCTEEEFAENLKKAGADMDRVVLVKGWFDQTLAESDAGALGIKKVAAAWIDCDLYESTVPVLDFLTTRLSVGSVLLFDDWRCFRNLPDYGQQRACREWLKANPQITLRELFSFSWHGQAFTVSSC